MDYFSERTNPFYDKTCNNEIVKMQRLSPEQLSNMTGMEYILLHVQEPILYVIRKQHRTSPQQAIPLADYYIIAGVVYQAPDLGSVLNSRLLNTINSLQTAFDEAQSYSKYHPSKGYWWKFKDKEQTEKYLNKDPKKAEEPSSLFQQQQVDLLLSELANKFPPKFQSVMQPEKPEEPVPEQKPDIKTEKVDEKVPVASSQSASVKQPPEKKQKLR
ncbi:hypothetical protein LSH36_500g01037 [Paralvinella palmiformis]|uniref:Mediator of RNA polymerase II transcription subunit 6 n=1 Tax=Paralvinella palmiformis TaxID=53620 RepID=A0AAD9MWV1_9ANNE|nr:hypothetical protein LSH36_500g01037 [Paralvinella palmiformis]